MSRSDLQTNIRLPAPLKTKLASAAATAGRSVTAEISSRLEASFISTDLSGHQPELIPNVASTHVDQVEAAGRVFSTTIQVAERMGTGQRRALEFAIRHTKRVTGIDWGEELRATASPSHAVATADSPAGRFLAAWQSGGLTLPWAPTLFTDVHAACLRWCVKQQLAGMPASHFAQAVEATETAHRQRKRWLFGDAVVGPASFVVPRGAVAASGQSETEWLGRCVTAFRKAAKRARLSA